jgi:hypothetical protein
MVVYLIVVQPFWAAAARKGCTTMVIKATKPGHTRLKPKIESILLTTHGT